MTENAMKVRKKNRPTRESEDVLALSFLDVLSCGLGASICLFLIFSVMPHVGIVGELSRALDPGEDEVVTTAGVKMDQDEAVKSAFVQIHAELGATTLTEDHGVWRGTRRREHVGPSAFLVTTAGSKVKFFAPILRSPKPTRRITFELRDAPAINTTCTVTLIAGGLPARSQSFPVASGAGSSRVFEIRLDKESDWVIPG